MTPADQSLVESGPLVESRPLVVGRPLVEGRPLVVGIDVGGTKVALRVVAFDEPGTTLGVYRVDTPVGSAEDLVEVLASAVASAVAGAGASEGAGERAGEGAGEGAGVVVAAGVGIAGLVTRQGVLRYSPNLPGILEFPLAERLAEALGCVVVVDNDATVATLAEWQLGAGVGADDLVLVTLGTGIGAGIVAGGQLQRGAHGFAGEPGHMIVEPAGAPCACGQRGCWEAYASGSALARLGADAMAAGQAPALVASGADGEVRGEDVAAAAAAGDPGATAVLDQFAWWVAVGVANLINVLDCSVVVIGGGLSELGDQLLGPVRRHVASLLMGAEHRPAVQVLAATLGPGAGSAGAALAAADAVGAGGGDGGSVG